MKLKIDKNVVVRSIVIDKATDKWIGKQGIESLIQRFLKTYSSVLGIHDSYVTINDEEVDDASLYIRTKEGVPFIYIDGALERIRELKEAIELARNEEERQRLENELSQLEHAATLLGKYVNEYDKKTDTEQPRIVLYRDAIVQSARRHGYDPLDLAIVVLVHELMHAYFDSGAKYVAETEEPLAELGCIYFMAKNEDTFPGLKQLAYEFCKEKLSFPCLYHYGRGSLLYDENGEEEIENLIREYHDSVYQYRGNKSV